MRSCFVPNCDVLCKNMTKRMMFIPPKNQELFNIWKSVLPNRRELKATDRVCERHFHSGDICKTFDHIINGTLHQIERGKPKLRETAIPSYNLPKTAEDTRDLKRKHNETDRKRKKQQQDITDDTPKIHFTVELTKTRRPIIKRLIKDFADKQSIDSEENITKSDYNTEKDTETPLGETRSITIPGEDSLVYVQSQTAVVVQDDESSPSYILQQEQRTDLQTTTDEELEYECVNATLFDAIYEDIYEVTLPNTLWGVHRDPKRTFIVFSYFDGTSMATSKLIHLDNQMNTHIYIKGKMVNKYVSNWSIEYLTNLVSRIDEYRICEKFEINSKCEVVAVDHNLCTTCR